MRVIHCAEYDVQKAKALRYNIIWMQHHLLFAFLSVPAEAILRVPVHLNSHAISVTRWLESVLLWNGACCVLLMLLIVEAETVVPPMSGNKPQVRYVSHQRGSIPGELRMQEVKTEKLKTAADWYSIYTCNIKAKPQSLTQFSHIKLKPERIMDTSCLTDFGDVICWMRDTRSWTGLLRLTQIGSCLMGLLSSETHSEEQSNRISIIYNTFLIGWSINVGAVFS